MSTQGKGTYLINSGWSSGSLVFYEKAYGRTATGDILTLSNSAVTIGGTSQDIDFKYYGTGSLSAIIDCGDATITLAGLKLVATLPAPTSGINNGFAISLTGGDAAPGTARAIIGAATTFSTMTSGNIVGVRGEVNMAGATSGTSYLYGVQGKAITGANTFTGTALAGVYAQIDVSTGTITSGHVAALQANIYGANSGTIPMEGIYIESAGGGVINSFMQCFGKSTYVFDFASNTHNQMSTTGTPGAVTGGTGWLKVLVEGSVRYIPLASSVS
jgi:hypothetical protein